MRGPTRLAFSPEDQPVFAKDLQGGHHGDDGQGEHGHHCIASHLLQLPAGAMHHPCCMHTLSQACLNTADQALYKVTMQDGC